jgi:hypothetical protein
MVPKGTRHTSVKSECKAPGAKGWQPTLKCRLPAGLGAFSTFRSKARACAMVITTTIVSLLILCLLPFAVSSSTTWAKRSDPIHVPLTRRSHKSRGLDDLAKAANNLRTKYNFQTVGSERKRGTTAAEPIINLVGSLKITLSALNDNVVDQQGDESYIGAINIGTPYVTNT